MIFLQTVESTAKKFVGLNSSTLTAAVVRKITSAQTSLRRIIGVLVSSYEND